MTAMTVDLARAELARMGAHDIAPPAPPPPTKPPPPRRIEPTALARALAVGIPFGASLTGIASDRRRVVFFYG